MDELFTNVAYYSYGDKEGTATIRLEIEEKPKVLDVTMIDSGIPFDPLDHDDPDINAPIGDRPIGGLGIYIMKQTMDQISYEYRDGQNIVRLRKILAVK